MFTVGLHPSHTAKGGLSAPQVQAISDLLQHPRCVALGEIGLDTLHAQGHVEKVRQRNAFRALCELDTSSPKALELHCRQEGEDDSFESLLEVAKKALPGERPFQFHCFTGKYMHSRRWLNRFPHTKFGVMGDVTKSKDQQVVVEQLGLDNLLLETDAPYLLPAGCVGPNHPWNLIHVAEALARIVNFPVAEVLRITRKNSHELYGLSQQ